MNFFNLNMGAIVLRSALVVICFQLDHYLFQMISKELLLPFSICNVCVFFIFPTY